MASGNNDTFFSSVPVFVEFEGVTDIENYRPLPEDWGLVTGDIVNSTGAIEAGSYKAVNMAGASIISAVLNTLGQQDLPFVFGGDGALVAVPASGLEKARTAMAAVRTWVKEELGLDMRAAIVPVTDVRAAGLDVRVARFRVSDEVSYAMFAGGGASWAESRMKENLYSVEPAPAATRPDLTGLSCRWNPIPSRHGEIVSIIAVPDQPGDGTAFPSLIADVVALASRQERGGHPIPADGPAAGFSSVGMEWEARASAPAQKRLWRKLFIYAVTSLGYFLFRFNLKFGTFDAKLYKRETAQNTDFRKFDDGLKMTIDVDAESLRKIEARLEAAANAGICRYGLHRQDAALMTCLVLTPLSHDHMHFVDGAAGGYALAAMRLKSKSASLVATAAATP
ncbi:DUF3095 domain-containing protein [Rhizobium sp. KVB221]|uniref:DUF3095 domain-containing protein n=1 Tax=Rhizobium setariae TaxID=2801340 RepID=A0A936YVG0_9HYPH|nr:DUF3095 domain-containing protein [Rhizobium setariae]MBL0373635.1 DUF3095 domain-containing protein [Rhizobium setariae]